MLDEDDLEEKGELFESDLPVAVLPNGEDFFVASDLLPPRLKPEKGEDFLFPLGPIAAEDEENGLLDLEDLLVLEEVPPNPLNPPAGDLFDAPMPPLPGNLFEPKGELPGPLLDEVEAKGELEALDDEAKGDWPSFALDIASNAFPNMPFSFFFPSASPTREAAPKLAAAANTAIPGMA